MIGGIVSAIVLLMTSAAVVQSKTNSSWRAMIDTHKALRAGWLAQPGTREPLWGSVSEGHAFTHYEQAAEIMGGIVKNDESLRDLVNKTDEQVAEMAGELREAWQPALAALRAGTHKSHRRITRANSVDIQTLNFLDYRWVSNAAAFETRYLRNAGDDLGSVHVTLDSLGMAVDTFNEGLLIQQMMSMAMIAIAIEPWTDEALRALAPDAATELAAGLAKLDTQMPEQLPTDRELLFLTQEFQKDSSQTEWIDGGSWRYGFSARWMLADALLMTSINYNRMNNSGTTDWQARQRLSDQIVKEVIESGNNLAGMMFPNVVSCEKSIRHSIGTVRLLRMALDMRRGVNSEPLDDPFGAGPLLIDESPETLTLRSVGSAGHEPLEFVIAR
ncbi:MAG: hypothetical protein ACI89X_002521 [Planctomycetota bacterium]|jgi:hypothetical protein